MQCWFSEKMKKNDKPLETWTKGEDTNLKIRNKTGAISTDSADNRRIIREYDEQLHTQI